MSVLVSDEAVRNYKADGVVCIRGVFNRKLISELLELWRVTEGKIRSMQPKQSVPQKLIDADEKLANELAASGTGIYSFRAQVESGSMGRKWAFFDEPAIRNFVYQSPAAQLLGELLESAEIKFFWDQMFVRKAGSTSKTYWHTDMPAWPVKGIQIPSLWVPMTSVRRSVNALEVIRGSHLAYNPAEWPRTYNARTIGKMPEGRVDFIDWETRRDLHPHRFIAFDMEPGDAMVIDPRAYHGGGSNSDPHNDRVALSTRWIGSDITWDPRPECVNIPGLPMSQMERGKRPDDETIFPTVWRRETAVA